MYSIRYERQAELRDSEAAAKVAAHMHWALGRLFTEFGLHQARGGPAPYERLFKF